MTHVEIKLNHIGRGFTANQGETTA